MASSLRRDERQRSGSRTCAPDANSPVWGSLLLGVNGKTPIVVDARGIAVATVEHAERITALTTEALYRRHSERVWRYCLHFLRRPADAEDAVQQTFLQAHRALGRGVQPEAEAAWLLAIARNVCLTRADTQRRRGTAEVSEDPRLLEVAAAVDGGDDGVSEDVRVALARLPERQRQALFLREWQECSYAEIAAALGTSESAVETLLFRARRTLARDLGASRRRDLGDLAGLLAWLRPGLGSAATKVVVGAAIVAVAVGGTDVATHGHRAHAVTVAHAVRSRPAVVARRPAAVAVARDTVARPHVASSQSQLPHVQRRRASPPPPPAAAASSAPSADPVPAPQPVQRTASPTPSTMAPPQPAVAPAAPAEQTTTTIANVVDSTTNAVGSTPDTVAQTASTAVPAAAPVVTTAAQTVSGATSAADATTQAAASTVSQLLPNH